MTVKSQKMVEDLKMLKKAHDVYKTVDEDRRGKLFLACEPIIVRLIGEGMERAFVETLLTDGKDFLDSLYGEGDGMVSEYDIEVIFSN